MLREQLATALETLVAGLELGESDDLLDARGEFLGESGVGNDILEAALGVGSDHADAERWRRVEGVRNSDLAGLQAVLIYDVLLGGKEQPHSLVVDRGILIIGVIVTNQGLFGRRLLLLLLS